MSLEAGLNILKTISPGTNKPLLTKLLEYLVIGLMIYGVYADASASLSTAKAARDEQIKGYSVQIGYQRTELEKLVLQQGLDSAQIKDLTEENERLRNWLKSYGERINRLEDIAMRRHK